MVSIEPWRIYYRGESCLHPSIRLVGWSKFRSADRLALPPHHHGDAYEIHYLRRGRLDVIVDGRVWSVRAGQAIVTRPQEVHSGVQSALQKCEFMWTQLNAGNLDSDISKMLDECAHARMIRVRSATGERLQHVLDYHGEPRDSHKVAARATMELFVCELCDAISDEHVVSDPIKKAMSRMAESISAPPRIEVLAEELGVSSSHLSSWFRNEVGETPGQWLLHGRLDAACRLLEAGEPNREIARKLGYSTPQNFATSFRRELGMTPSEYRSYIRGLSDGILPSPFYD